MKYLEEYLHESDAVLRMGHLTKMSLQNSRLSLDLVQDLLELELPLSEQEVLLNLVENPKSLQFEEYLTENLGGINVDKAVLFINSWANLTGHILRDNLLKLLEQKHTSQRLLYTILLKIEAFDPHQLLNHYTKIEGLFDYSDAFQALLLDKAIHYAYYSETLVKLAQLQLADFENQPYPQSKAILPAVLYLGKYNSSVIQQMKDYDLGLVWRSSIEQMEKEDSQAVTPSKIKSNTFLELMSIWPSILTRHKVTSEAVLTYLQLSVIFLKESHKKDSVNIINFGLAGCDVGAVKEAIKKCDDHEISVLQNIIEQYSQSNKKVPKKIPVQSKATISDRHKIFNFLFRGFELEEISEQPWKHIYDCYKNPTEENLNLLTEITRKSSGVYKQVFFKTFSAFTNKDLAVLKILDYLHTDVSYEQTALIDSLVGIGTARAAQELFNLLGRPNVAPSQKIQIAKKISALPVKMLQKQIKNMLNEVQRFGLSKQQRDEIVEILSDYLDTPNVATKPVALTTSSVNISIGLTKLIPEIDSLSAEVRRALKTGMFFYDQAKAAGSDSGIDLSPVIDMQYKALEIYLRESFQQNCDYMIRDGVIQRKLDILGYSRPIPEKMEQFENYIASLPIVNNIPYFSKFKLRKMLLALCQFRPTKRFTLDGIKAFSLFFLCFSRRECRFGLQNILPMAFASDKDLFDFCSQLHILQDFRNRAVHEGLPPETENNMESTWAETAKIINEISRLNTVHQFVKKHEINSKTPEPVIIRKVS